jgi:alpha-L-fucosidase 2
MSTPHFWAALPLLFLILFMGSSAAGAPPSVRRGVEYGDAGGTRLLMDYQLPDGNGPFPAAVVVHGGGWIAGDRRSNVEPLFAPLTQAGIAWFSISYRLASDAAVFGAAITDVVQAVGHVRDHAAEYNIDPNRIALVGESAGAQLASMAALSTPLKGSVKGVVALYSPSDLATLAKTSDRIPAELRRAVENTAWAEFILAGLERLSPIYNVRPDMPPFLLIHGTADRLVPFSQSEQMCAKMHEVGASCELFAVKGGGHGIRWWESEGFTSYKQVMVQWLERTLDGHAAE